VARPAYPFAEPTSTVLIRRGILAVLLVLMPLFAMSSYRAYVQIKSFDLAVPDTVLGEGGRVDAHVVSWARTFVQLRIELIQGARVDTLAIKEVPRNWDPVFDFRPRRDSLTVTLTPQVLARFQPGPALVRAAARGSMQWLREPPPQVRERVVVITGAAR
jgi:hypothetical protein